MTPGKKTKAARLTLPFLKKAMVNYLCGASLVLTGFFCIKYLPCADRLFSVTHDFFFFQLTAEQMFVQLLPVFLILLVPYYLTLPCGIKPKSRLVWHLLIHLGRKTPGVEEKTALRAWLLKIFFLPLMLSYLLHNTAWLFHTIYNLSVTGYSFANIYWLPFSLMILTDVSLYTLGYALEHPRLKNEIRSVDATLLGWVVCLACYPPLNYLTAEAFGWSFGNYPDFHHPWARALTGSVMILLITVYALSALALNLKASNLTHRGVVTTGPFRYVRHPAYAAKLLTWYLGALPALIQHWDAGLARFMAGIGSMAAWSLLYYLRALTEERHLSSDPEYNAYCRKVTKRFIPGVF